MTSFPNLPRGLWFEEFEAGQKLTTSGRTVTEADIVNFAGISGDHHPIHMDAQYGAETGYGQRVAHGLLVVSIVTGLVVQTAILDGTLGAFREINNWKFKHPVFIGDTIRAEAEVGKIIQLKGVDAGMVEIRLKVLNQDDLVVMTGKLTLVMLSRPK